MLWAIKMKSFLILFMNLSLVSCVLPPVTMEDAPLVSVTTSETVEDFRACVYRHTGVIGWVPQYHPVGVQWRSNNQNIAAILGVQNGKAELRADKSNETNPSGEVSFTKDILIYCAKDSDAKAPQITSRWPLRWTYGES